MCHLQTYRNSARQFARVRHATGAENMQMQQGLQREACLLVGRVAVLPVVGVLGVLGNVRGLVVRPPCRVLCSLGGGVGCLLCNPLSLLSGCLTAGDLVLDCLRSQQNFSAYKRTYTVC